MRRDGDVPALHCRVQPAKVASNHLDEGPLCRANVEDPNGRRPKADQRSGIAAETCVQAPSQGTRRQRRHTDRCSYLTELALALTSMKVEPQDRCMSCRATFGYSWTAPEKKATKYKGRLFPSDTCAEVIMYLGCLEAHAGRKRRWARRLQKKKQLARQAEGRRRRRRSRSRRC